LSWILALTKGHNEAISGSVASSSDRRYSASERDDIVQNAALHSKPDGDIDANGGEENAGLVFDNNAQSHNEPDGSIGRNVQWVEAGSVECEAGTSHGGKEQPTITQAESLQQNDKERKGKQWQRKRAITRTTLEEALARVDTADGASLDTLNAL
jgi:hypothetical protein